METSVRRAGPEDLKLVAKLAGALVRMHHEADESRFFLPEHVEEGYAYWFARELRNDRAVLLVAEHEKARDIDDSQETIIGYAYGTREGRDWNLLLDDHGAIHDVFVAPNARRSGVGRKLLEAIVAELRDLGAPRILLSTMVKNTSAQALFRACGFRPTMLEMTCDV